ncbi:hypothetical protein GDO86_006886 [Hymenochirus boettgeri]|uniref:GATA-type domain-containing protein n=1 Tax=Hymenochirus boettgeri TaxID=247094 RepID=A0A8T2JFG0_9PIPI|nr:hypothetical protein GDO86_006886 [Hymenochirus boettgeri]
MDRVLFVEGTYPDFSLLKEILSPPCLEEGPGSTGSDIISQWSGFQSSTELQYPGKPQGVTVWKETSKHTARQCRGRTQGGARSRLAERHRGGLDRGSPKTSKSRCCGANVQIGCKYNSHKLRDKTEYLMQPPETDILYLMQESSNLLPELKNGAYDPSSSCPEDTRNACAEYCCAPFSWSHSRLGQESSMFSKRSPTQNYNALELLNLISSKCSSLHDIGGEECSLVEKNLVLSTNEVGESLNLAVEVGSSAFANEGQMGEDVTETKPQYFSRISMEGQPVNKVDCNSKDTLINAETSENDDKSLEGIRSPIKACSSDQELCSRKTPRKQRTPTKSMQKMDPSFQGIEFQMHLSLEKENCGDYRLIVSSMYRRRSRNGSVKSKRRLNSTSLSSSSEEDQASVFPKQNKRCASCKTQKTPLWRDAEDGTPLCNACGIRYKKYGVRCYDCWNIPKKDGKSYSRYCDCGGTFRVQI